MMNKLAQSVFILFLLRVYIYKIWYNVIPPSSSHAEFFSEPHRHL